MTLKRIIKRSLQLKDNFYVSSVIVSLVLSLKLPGISSGRLNEIHLPKKIAV